MLMVMMLSEFGLWFGTQELVLFIYLFIWLVGYLFLSAGFSL